MSLRKGRLSHDVAELGRGVGEEAIAVRQQEIEFAKGGNDQRQFVQRGKEGSALRVFAAEALAQRLQNPAESPFAVGQANGQKAAIQRRRKVDQIAVVGKNPVAAPEFAHERMRVFEADGALCRLADMSDDVL